MSEAFDSLNHRQQQFVLEYIKDFNGTQAAIRAGYSKKTARSKGAQLLAHVNIQHELQEQIKAQQERTKVDADYMLNLLKEDVEADIADLYDENNNLKPVKEWPKVWRRGLVSGLDVQTIGTDEESIATIVKAKLADRTKLKELLGRHKAVAAFEKESEFGNIHITIQGKDAEL
jgi:phage terminase small subunit